MHEQHIARHRWSATGEVTIFLERKFRTHSKKREEGRGKQFTG
jgi:hypothetical protein